MLELADTLLNKDDRVLRSEVVRPFHASDRLELSQRNHSDWMLGHLASH
jgi:hypothetical protein